MTQPPEIRLNDDKTLDEIVAENAFVHLEQMGDNCWWMTVECGGQSVRVWFSARGKITAHFEQLKSEDLNG